MGGDELSIALSCVKLLCYVYASIIVPLGTLDWIFVFLLLSGALVGTVFYLRIPRPAPEVVTNILGTDWSPATENGDNIVENNDSALKIIAHRACGLDAPENSLAAVRKMAKEGIQAVEFDIMLSADGVPVVFHDDNLSRMTTRDDNVSQMLVQDLVQIDISSKHPFGNLYGGQRIPLLTEFIAVCLELKLRMILDLKVEGSHIKMATAILDLFKKYPVLHECAIVSSFNPWVIYEIRSRMPSVMCSVAWRPYFFSYQEYSGYAGPTLSRSGNPFVMAYLRLLERLYEWFLLNLGYYILGISAVLLHKDCVTMSVVRLWRKKGVRVLAWTVNLPTEKQYFDKCLAVPYLTDTVINS